MSGPQNRKRATSERVEKASERLREAMTEESPSCAGDPRFTASRPSPLKGDERRELYLTCFACPIFEACAEYADATKPAAGYWAGKNFGTWERKL